jgi:hypothetical protein
MSRSPQPQVFMSAVLARRPTVSLLAEAAGAGLPR